MKCHLCKKEKKLIKAHIIPGWCFRYLYDKNHGKREPLIFATIDKNSITHNGIYDGEILCENCDGFLGTFDDYGRKILIEKKIKSLNNGLSIIKDVDIEKLKIFFLSVLWRASISKRPEFLKVDIGPFEDKIWEILNKVISNKGCLQEISRFSIIVRKFISKKYPDLARKNIQLPLYERIESINHYRLYFPNGFIILIKTDKRSLPEILKPIETNGTDVLILEKDFENSKDLEFMAKAIINKQKRKLF